MKEEDRFCRMSFLQPPLEHLFPWEVFYFEEDRDSIVAANRKEETRYETLHNRQQ
jgi:hypothetical protein